MNHGTDGHASRPATSNKKSRHGLNLYKKGSDHVGLLTNSPTRRFRSAIYLVIRITNAVQLFHGQPVDTLIIAPPVQTTIRIRHQTAELVNSVIRSSSELRRGWLNRASVNLPVRLVLCRCESCRRHPSFRVRSQVALILRALNGPLS